MAIKNKSDKNYTIDGVIRRISTKTLKNTKHFKVKNTYSILTSKLSHTKANEEKTIINIKQL